MKAWGTVRLRYGYVVTYMTDSVDRLEEGISFIHAKHTGKVRRNFPYANVIQITRRPIGDFVVVVDQREWTDPIFLKAKPDRDPLSQMHRCVGSKDGLVFYVNEDHAQFKEQT